jgi:hypothetical protein
MQAIPYVEAVDETPVADSNSTLGLAELLLKDPVQVDRLTRDEARQSELIPRLLALVVLCFTSYSLVLAAVLHFIPRKALPSIVAERWSGSVACVAALWAAYTFGMIAASGICLPSFYFFGLLAGARLSVAQTVAHVVKGKGATAIMLLGLLPIYFTVVLGMIVFNAPIDKLEWSVYLGLALPFLAGLWGVRSIYRGFLNSDDLPVRGRCLELAKDDRLGRVIFLRRLIIAWAVCYTAVTPVMIWTLWKMLAPAAF